jgi:hypothetical protein
MSALKGSTQTFFNKTFLSAKNIAVDKDLPAVLYFCPAYYLVAYLLVNISYDY